jgi:DNA/RNA-binding domain of Phe-tRNA-synthetase-like protein
MIPLEIEVTTGWHQAFPGAQIGLLLVGSVDNRQPSPVLEQHKREVEARLRSRYAGYDRPMLLQNEVLSAYKAYYKRFNKTYHVLLQLESVLGGKSLPSVNPLVDACFAAELETHLLTASHDAELLSGISLIQASVGGEQIIQLGGAVKVVPPGDMLMRDDLGVVCTVIYGPDQRTAITPATRAALYVTYVPPGISAETVSAHHETIIANLLRFAPQAQVSMQIIHHSTDNRSIP